MTGLRPGPSAARGFALVLCLWAVVIVLLLAAALDRYVAASIEQARAIRVRLQDELDMYSTQQTLLYLLGTRRFTRAGLTTNAPEQGVTGVGGAADAAGLASLGAAGALGIEPVGDEIALDGSVYRGLGQTRFALQDETGLIALNSDNQDELRKLLASFGADETETGRLLDTLADYRDDNVLIRLNGAEAEQYTAAGEAPPPNKPLRSAAEIVRVLGWREWLAAHPGLRMQDWASAASEPTFNPNVMPAALLARMPGLDEAASEEILGQRRVQPFRSLADFDARTHLALTTQENLYRFFPSGSLQLRIWRRGAAHANLLALQLTPSGQQGPWQIKSIYRVSQSLQDEVHEVPGVLFGANAPSDN